MVCIYSFYRSTFYDSFESTKSQANAYVRTYTFIITSIYVETNKENIRYVHAFLHSHSAMHVTVHSSKQKYVEGLT